MTNRARPREGETARVAYCHDSRMIKVDAGRPDVAAAADSVAADQTSDLVAIAPVTSLVVRAACETRSIDSAWTVHCPSAFCFRS